MSDAWIAVIGTLGGVVVTAGVSLLAVVIAGRHQRDHFERTSARESAHARRQELRSVYADYMSAYSTMRDRVVVLAEQRAIEAEANPGSIEAFAPDESAELSRAYHTLRIVAPDETGAAARETTAYLWQLARIAATGTRSEFDEAWPDGSTPRRRLRQAMRFDLGVGETTE